MVVRICEVAKICDGSASQLSMCISAASADIEHDTWDNYQYSNSVLSNETSFVQAAAVEGDVRDKAKTVQQMVSELAQKKVSSHRLQPCRLSRCALRQ